MNFHSFLATKFNFPIYYDYISDYPRQYKPICRSDNRKAKNIYKPRIAAQENCYLFTCY